MIMYNLRVVLKSSLLLLRSASTSQERKEARSRVLRSELCVWQTVKHVKPQERASVGCVCACVCVHLCTCVSRVPALHMHERGLVLREQAWCQAWLCGFSSHITEGKFVNLFFFFCLCFLPYKTGPNKFTWPLWGLRQSIPIKHSEQSLSGKQHALSSVVLFLQNHLLFSFIPQ